MNKRRVFVLGALAAGAGAAHWRTHQAPAPPAVPHDAAIAALRATDGSDGFAHAEAARMFAFPRDHGPHGDFRAEWWYFTGHLRTPEGRPFGFQLTVFRYELDAAIITSSSAWRTPRVLLAHFALSDIAGHAFHPFERYSRAVPAVAGIRADPLALWLDDWRIDYAADSDRWHLSAAQGDIALALQLDGASAIVLQGDKGLSRKSASAGNASYYYSVPRLNARGTLTVGGTVHAVDGTAWLDREWSSGALAREQQGWDWFGLQLDSGASLMFYRLRGADGNTGQFSDGTLIGADGHRQRLSATAVALTALGAWTSPYTGTRYPQGWRLTVVGAGLDLLLTPRLPDQEWRARLRYWEGAVAVTAVADGRPLGLGYVELTGY